MPAAPNFEAACRDARKHRVDQDAITADDCGRGDQFQIIFRRLFVACMFKESTKSLTHSRAPQDGENGATPADKQIRAMQYREAQTTAEML
jgi:hypothetical protein